jgi:phosphate transport system substrate-binding protein
MDTLLLPSSEGIIAEVRQNPNAIGYDGLGYVPEDLKMIAIAEEEGGAYVLPSIPTVNEYLDWILASEAQEIVAELGFVPATLTPSSSD